MTKDVKCLNNVLYGNNSYDTYSTATTIIFTLMLKYITKPYHFRFYEESYNHHFKDCKAETILNFLYYFGCLHMIGPRGLLIIPLSYK